LLILYFKLFARLDSNLVGKAEPPLHSPVAESSAALEPLVKSSGDEEKVKDGMLLVPKR
jgi:hypothetical protein